MSKYDIKYRITDIKPKNGANPFHYGMKNSICYPAFLLAGQRGLMLIETDDVMTPIHRFQTSVISSITYTIQDITIETQNTIYVLTIVEE